MNQMKVGEHAQLQGLQARPELNGQEVILTLWLHEKNRWQCELVGDPEKCINVMPSNLLQLRGSRRSPVESRDDAEDRFRRRTRAATRAASEPSSPAMVAAPVAQRTTGAVNRTASAKVASHAEENSSEQVVVSQDTELEPGLKRSRLSGKKERTIEEIYQKKSQLEHILLRPDSYVGSVERQRQDHWMLDASATATASSSSSSSPGLPKMVRRSTEFVPALYKIFDEIIVNAADHLIRDPSMDTIKVRIDANSAAISVWNNGRGLPVEMHKEHKVYVPEMVFGQLLTSDNYDDSEKKVVGGRNGYGAKLTNIYSQEFVVETADSARGRAYRQVWRNNIRERENPEITDLSGGTDFTAITFHPDLARLGMNRLEEDIVALMHRRAFDVAASTRGRCKVYLNDALLQVHSFEDYVGLFLRTEDFRKVEVCNDRWEVAVALTDGSGFQQVSFVNSIATSRGGTHVNYVADQVVAALMDCLAKKKGGEKTGLSVKPQHVRNHLWIFVNCLIENPAFDSQTKETLTSKKDRFGSTCDLSAELLEAVCESGVVESLHEWSKALGKSELARHLNKSDLGLQKRLFGVPKLEDANMAGTKQSQDCVLIVTEGDSAKALAVAGLGVVGRDYYGVFPLRGKLRNVREMSVKQMMDNKEIEALCKILALDATKKYEDNRGLRYGSLCIMADQDFDGSHIKGLVINFIHHWFPGLTKVPGFVCEFITPIVKATRGDEVATFFTVPEYEAWKKNNNDGVGWKCKYYKGLGTSTSSEARDYFSDLETHKLDFTETNKDDDLIDMAFNAKRADDRKEWITKCDDDVFVDHSQPSLSYEDFVNKELVLWAKYDVERAIPSLVDGLKPGQRKVIYGTFLKKLTHETKVAQLSGFVAEKASYHHGEVSLQGTIIGMAQNFVGSNNINLLMPCGQFGTRIQGGKDHAASRYIFTKLSPMARLIFPDMDDHVLEHQTEEGHRIEPRWYCPVIPMVLVNGAEGIGVGWSTSVPCYNPQQLIDNLRRHLRGEPMEPMLPWYRGFKGTVSLVKEKGKDAVGRFETIGVARQRGMTRIEVTELPVRRWTQDYKEWLLEQLASSEGKRSTLTEFREYHTDNTVHFSLVMPPDKAAAAQQKGLERFLHLRSTLATTNMFLIDAKGQLRKYDSPEAIFVEFAMVRLEVYGKRKDYHVGKLAREAAFLSDRARFVRLVVEEKLIVDKRSSKVVCADMRSFRLRTKKEIEEGSAEGWQQHDLELSPRRQRSNSSQEQPEYDLAGPMGYAYLLKMKLWSLTEERVAQLENQREQKLQELAVLKATTLEQLWEADLVQLEKGLRAQEAAEAAETAQAERLVKKKAEEIDNDLVNRQCVLVLSSSFSQIKRIRTDQWRSARRRGRHGQRIVSRQRKKEGTDVQKEDADGDEENEQQDKISAAFVCHEFDALLAFTQKGFVHSMQALDVPLAKRIAAGSAVKELLPGLEADDRITSVIAVPQGALKDQGNEFAVLITAMGFGKKVPLSSFRNVKPGKGVCAITLEEGDELRGVHRASEQDILIISSLNGFVLCFPIWQMRRCVSIKARGTSVMRLKDKDDTVGAFTVARLDEGVKDAILKHARRAKPAETIAQPSKGESEDAKPAAPPAEEPARKRLRKASVCDDDDSDNEPAAPAGNVASQKEDTTAGDVEMDEDEAEAQDAAEEPEAEDAVEDALDDEDANDAGVEQEAEAEDAPLKDSTSPLDAAMMPLCVLLVSRDGMGKRVKMRNLKLLKRNQRGHIAFKPDVGDAVVAAFVTYSDEPTKLPRKPREPAVLYQEVLQAEQQARNAQDASNDSDKPVPYITVEEAEWLLAKLTEKQRRPFQQRHCEEQEAYETAVTTRREEWPDLCAKCGQVLLCTAGGLAIRVEVAAVGVKNRTAKGVPLMKVPASDAVISVSHLSSLDVEQDEVPAGDEEQQKEQQDDEAKEMEVDDGKGPG
jgi:DNA topoisomerase II